MPITAHFLTEEIKRPAIVLVHGLGSAGNIWKSLIPQSTKDFSVFAIDLPGHGVVGLHENEAVDPRSLARAIAEEAQPRNFLQASLMPVFWQKLRNT